MNTHAAFQNTPSPLASLLARLALSWLVLAFMLTPARAANTFENTGALVAGRYAHTSTLLPGGKVLVVGGQATGGGFLASAEIYDPATGFWSATGSLAAARGSHTATLLPNGKVLIAGGLIAGYVAVSGAEIYDPATGAWSAAGTLANAGGYHTATLLPNGKVLVAGGYTDASGSIGSAQIFDPATGLWSATGALGTSRYVQTATLLPNGKVLVVGGYNTASNYLASAELYDPATGTWSATGALASARYFHSATLLPGGKVLVAAGLSAIEGSIESAELYDPASGIWSGTGALGVARYTHTASLLPNGKVLITGGSNSEGGGILNSAEIYDPAAGVWSVTGALGAARYFHTATLLPGGKVLVAAGLDGVGNALTSAQLFDPNIGAGDVDEAFNPAPNSTVRAIAVQPDGKILVGGGFTTIVGESRTYLARLNADGSLDSAFNPTIGIGGSAVNCIALQADGKIVIGGTFTTVSGQARKHIARLNGDGSLDAFDPPVVLATASGHSVISLAIQPDGKIVAGGFFPQSGTGPRSSIARINTDGTMDTGFGPTANTQVNTVAVQPDGKIIIGGQFATVNGVSRTRLARLLSNGSLDFAFNVSITDPVFASVSCLTLEPDGEIIVGGGFQTLGGVSCSNLGRLTPAGTFDTSYQPNSNNAVYAATQQADGQTVFAGAFTTMTVTPRNYISRSLMTGSLDGGFDPNANNFVYGSAVQADGKLVIGGEFDMVGTSSRSRLARLENDAATQSLAVLSTDRVRWLRGGTSPEAQDVTFEHSSDGGATWSPLGAGTRINGGWERTGNALPSAGQIRARARTTGGRNNGSTGLVESVQSYQPLLSTQDTDGDGLNDAAEFQLAPQGFDWQTSQPALVNNLFAHANTAGLFTPTQVQALHIGTPLLARNPGTGQFTLTIGVQKATNLTSFSAFPMTAPQTFINAAGKLEFTFGALDNAAFFRLQSQP